MDSAWGLFGDGEDSVDGESDEGFAPEVEEAEPEPTASAPAPARPPRAQLAPSIEGIRGFAHEHLPQTCKDLSDVGADATSKSLMSAFVDFQRSAFPGCAKKAEEVVDGAYARLQSAGGWDHVAWREAHGFGSMLAAASLFLGGESVRAVKLLDMALILGAPPDVVQPLLAEADTAARLKLATVPLEAVEEAAASAIQSAGPDALKIPDTLRDDRAPRWSGDALPTRSVEAAGLTADAFRPMYAEGQPVLMPGLAKAWPACRKWASMAFWTREFGHRTVPLEIGRHGDAVWREEPLSLRRFIAEYLLPSNRAGRGAGVGPGEGTPSKLASVLQLDLPLERVAYLAQHALCDQLPQLQRDFEVPAPCHLGNLTRINVWFGTQETVTPLHFDGYDNVIVQMAGYKYLRLYGHDQTPLLYVQGGAKGSAGARGEEGEGWGGGTTAQGNISQVDVECPDLEQFPRFAEAQYREVLLRPGDALFMPQGLWHYVRSLTTSVSINYWFSTEETA